MMLKFDYVLDHEPYNNQKYQNVAYNLFLKDVAFNNESSNDITYNKVSNKHVSYAYMYVTCSHCGIQ